MATDTLKFHCFTFRMPNKFFKNIFIKKKEKKEKKNKTNKKKYIHILTRLLLLRFWLAEKFIHMKQSE